MSSHHDTRAKRDQHGTDAQRDNQVMTDGGDALPNGEVEQALAEIRSEQYFMESFTGGLNP